MARGLFRKFSIGRMIGAYRSQLMRSLLRLFTFGFYGKKGMGWIKDPKKAWYNRIYYRTSISLPRILGYKPSRGAFIFAMVVGTLFSIVAAPFDWTRTGVKASKIKKSRKARGNGSLSGGGRGRGARGGSYGYSSESSGSGGGSFRNSSGRDNYSDNFYESSGSSRDTSGMSESSSSDSFGESDGIRESSDNTRGSTGTIRNVTVKSDSPRDSQRSSASSDPIPRGSSKPKTPPQTTRPRAETASVAKKSYSSSSSPKKTEDKPTPKTQSGMSTKPRAKPVQDDGVSAYSQVKLYTSDEPRKATEGDPKQRDESSPKSAPLNEGDQYIRKRMIIAGNYYCDQDVISRLKAGDYFQFVAEPENPHDKNAVALYFQGAKIGYVAKQDVTPIVACLRLGRGIYGVITDVKTTDGKKELEYEAWITVKR